MGPLGPRHPFPPLTCAFCSTLLIPPGWAQQGPFLWEASWASPQKRPVSSSGILRSFTRFSVKTLVFCSVFLGACLASERSCVCPAWASPRPALWLAHSRCSGGNSHLPTQPPVLPRPRPPQHQQLRGGCLGLRKPRKGALLLPAPSGARRPTVQVSCFGLQLEERGLGLLTDSKLPQTKTDRRALSPPGRARDWLRAAHLLPGRVVGRTDEAPQPADVAAAQGDHEAQAVHGAWGRSGHGSRRVGAGPATAPQPAPLGPGALRPRSLPMAT